jgi:benzodiazapine receptor
MTIPILVAAGVTLLLLTVGGLATNVGPWYRNLRKPSWNPPNWAFGPGWTIILSLAAWAGVLAWTHTTNLAAHVRIASLFGANICKAASNRDPLSASKRDPLGAAVCSRAAA